MGTVNEKAVIELIVNGEVAKTSLKEVEASVRKLRAEFKGMREDDNPEAYRQKVNELGKMNAAYREMQGQVKGVTSEWGKFMERVESTALGVGLKDLLVGGLERIKEFFTGSVEEYKKAEQANVHLEAALRSTGGAAGMTKTELDKLADGLMRVTKVDDDDIKSVEALLLTFTNIGKNVFPQATESILNLSEALGQDLQSSTVQLGKALNDPIQGITALRRVGVSFNEEQVKTIKNLQESGNLLGAQKLILAELEKEFGGMARAAAKAETGGLDQFMVKIGNIKEAIGGLIVQGLSALAREFTPLVDVITASFVPASERAVTAFQDQQKAVRGLDNETIPLLNRYDQLKDRSNLSAKEQAELRDIIEKIAQTIPTAITEFDKYGKALGISSEKVREFTEQQKAMLLIRNKEAIKENQESLKDLEGQLADVNDKLNHRDSEGNITKMANMRSALIRDVKLSGDEIQKLQNQLADLQQQKLGTEGILNELKGVAPAIRQVNAEITQTKTLTDEEKKALKEFLQNTKKLTEELRDAKAQAITQEENRAVEVARTKMQNRVQEINLEKADVQVKNQLLKALEEQYQREITDIHKKHFDERTKKEYDRAVQDLAEYLGQEKLILTQQYISGAATEKQYHDQLIELEKKGLEAKLQLQKDYSKSTAEVEKALADEQLKLYKDGLKRENQERLAEKELAVRSAEQGSRDQIKAELAFLREKMHQELMNTELTEHEKANIQQKYRLLEEKAEEDSLLKQVETFKTYLSQAENSFSSFTRIQANEDNADLAKDKKANDQKKRNLDNLLKGKVISQQQHDSQVQAMDDAYNLKQSEYRKKEFEINKQAQAIKAAINTAEQVTKVLAEPPLAIAVGIAGALEIAAIESQSTPEFKDGAILEGPSHEGGGIHMIDSQTGKKVGEMEGGETYMILSKKVTSSNRALIGTLLEESLHGGGKSILPSMELVQTARKMERGGLVQAPSTLSQPIRNTSPVPQVNSQANTEGLNGNTTGELYSFLLRLEPVLTKLNDRLDQPIQAEAFFDYQKFKREYATLDGIRKDAGIGA